jgi:hypothetical protein
VPSFTADASFDVGMEDIDELLGSLGRGALPPAFRLYEVITNVILHHLRHQARRCPPHPSDQVHDLIAAGLLLQGTLNGLNLPPKSPDPDEELLLFTNGMRHVVIIYGVGGYTIDRMTCRRAPTPAPASLDHIRLVTHPELRHPASFQPYGSGIGQGRPYLLIHLVKSASIKDAFRPNPQQTTLYVEVSQLSELESKLQGERLIMPRRTTFYGSTEVAYTDPAGNIIVFAERQAAPSV